VKVNQVTVTIEIIETDSEDIKMDNIRFLPYDPETADKITKAGRYYLKEGMKAIEELGCPICDYVDKITRPTLKAKLKSRKVTYKIIRE